MNLTLREKIALIYTSAGSQRNVAALVGVSHQKIGRILKAGYEGGYPLNSRVLHDPGLSAAVNVALSIHVDLARDRARRDKIPFSADVPVYYARMPKVDGTPGDRVAALNTHWLPDRVRNAWIAWIQRSRKFYAASVQSIINLKFYNNRAEKFHQGAPRTPTQKLFRKEFKAMQKAGLDYAPVNTPYTPLDIAYTPSEIIADIDEKLRTKHEPAATDDKCVIGSQILLQIDTVNTENADSTKPRKKASPKKRTR